MKRFLTPAVAEQAVAKRGRSELHHGGQTLAQHLVHGSWTDLGEGARVAYWPAKLSYMCKRAMRVLLNDVDWQQVWNDDLLRNDVDHSQGDLHMVALETTLR